METKSLLINKKVWRMLRDTVAPACEWMEMFKQMCNAVRNRELSCAGVHIGLQPSIVRCNADHEDNNQTLWFLLHVPG